MDSRTRAAEGFGKVFDFVPLLLHYGAVTIFFEETGMG
jgi:hypothetical protein